MNIRDLQSEAQQLQDWKWPEDKYNIDAAFKKLVEEVGELSKALNYESTQDIGYEMADVLLTLLGLAVRCNIDVQSMTAAKWEIVKDRLGYTEAMKQPWDQLSLV